MDTIKNVVEQGTNMVSKAVYGDSSNTDTTTAEGRTQHSQTSTGLGRDVTHHADGPNPTEKFSAPGSAAPVRHDQGASVSGPSQTLGTDRETASGFGKAPPSSNITALGGTQQNIPIGSDTKPSGNLQNLAHDRSSKTEFSDTSNVRDTVGTGSHHHTSGTHGLGSGIGTHTASSHPSQTGSAPYSMKPGERTVPGTSEPTNIHGGSHHTSGATGFGSSGHSSDNTGPHKSKIANKLDPRVDSDRDHRGTTGHSSTGHGSSGGVGAIGGLGSLGSSGHSSNTAGPHSSDMANKADPRVDSDRDHRGTSGHTSGGMMGSSATRSSNTAGPHSSDMANKADPRVDSDRDHRGTSGHTSGGMMGSSTTHSSNTGPHSSNIANKLDPRVDSDRDNRGTSGHTSGHTSGGMMGSSTSHSSTAGPHSSNVANKLDPRVDSDRDNRGTSGHHTSGAPIGGITSGPHRTDEGLTPGDHTLNKGSSTFGTTGHSSNTAGPHSSNVGNKLDPRVDSDRDHRGTTGHTSGGIMGTSGHSTNVGPHSSNTGNKLDPRVDSDRDHRGTAGGLTGSTGHTTTHSGHRGSGNFHPDGPEPLPLDNSAPSGPTHVSARVKDTPSASGVHTMGEPMATTGDRNLAGAVHGGPSFGVDNTNAAGSSLTGAVHGMPTTTATGHQATGTYDASKAPIGSHQGSDRPTQDPSHNDHIGSNVGPGHVERATGFAADGGNFDAEKPGAGREADRLMGTHDGSHGAQDSKHGHNTHGHNTHGGTGTHGDKPSVTDKIKEKLHLGGKH